MRIIIYCRKIYCSTKKNSWSLDTSRDSQKQDRIREYCSVFSELSIPKIDTTTFNCNYLLQKEKNYVPNISIYGRQNYVPKIGHECHRKSNGCYYRFVLSAMCVFYKQKRNFICHVSIQLSIEIKVNFLLSNNYNKIKSYSKNHHNASKTT